MTWEGVVAIGLELPEVEESRSHGRPALKVRRRFFAGSNTKEKAVVLKVASIDEQSFLIETAPRVQADLTVRLPLPDRGSSIRFESEISVAPR